MCGGPILGRTVCLMMIALTVGTPSMQPGVKAKRSRKSVGDNLQGIVHKPMELMNP